MSRYIDADDVAQRIIYYLSHTPESCGEHYAYKVALKEIVGSPTANVAELKNMKWRPHYYTSKAIPPIGGKRQEGWCCSICGKHSYSRKEICDGCNTVMWKAEVR